MANDPIEKRIAKWATMAVVLGAPYFLIGYVYSQFFGIGLEEARSAPDLTPYDMQECTFFLESFTADYSLDDRVRAFFDGLTYFGLAGVARWAGLHFTAPYRDMPQIACIFQTGKYAGLSNVIEQVGCCPDLSQALVPYCEGVEPSNIDLSLILRNLEMGQLILSSGLPAAVVKLLLPWVLVKAGLTNEREAKRWGQRASFLTFALFLIKPQLKLWYEGVRSFYDEDRQADYARVMFSRDAFYQNLPSLLAMLVPIILILTVTRVFQGRLGNLMTTGWAYVLPALLALGCVALSMPEGFGLFVAMGLIMLVSSVLGNWFPKENIQHGVDASLFSGAAALLAALYCMPDSASAVMTFLAVGAVTSPGRRLASTLRRGIRDNPAAASAFAVAAVAVGVDNFCGDDEISERAAVSGLLAAP